jgi:hypothetical protein
LIETTKWAFASHERRKPFVACAYVEFTQFVEYLSKTIILDHPILLRILIPHFMVAYIDQIHLTQMKKTLRLRDYTKFFPTH